VPLFQLVVDKQVSLDSGATDGVPHGGDKGDAGIKLWTADCLEYFEDSPSSSHQPPVSDAVEIDGADNRLWKLEQRFADLFQCKQVIFGLILKPRRVDNVKHLQMTMDFHLDSVRLAFIRALSGPGSAESSHHVSPGVNLQGFSPLTSTFSVVRDLRKDDLPDPVGPISRITGASDILFRPEFSFVGGLRMGPAKLCAQREEAHVMPSMSWVARCLLDFTSSRIGMKSRCLGTGAWKTLGTLGSDALKYLRLGTRRLSKFQN